MLIPLCLSITILLMLCYHLNSPMPFALSMACSYDNYHQCTSWSCWDLERRIQACLVKAASIRGC